jgi:hypothetical protein
MLGTQQALNKHEQFFHWCHLKEEGPFSTSWSHSHYHIDGFATSFEDIYCTKTYQHCCRAAGFFVSLSITHLLNPYLIHGQTLKLHSVTLDLTRNRGTEILPTSRGAREDEMIG